MSISPDTTIEAFWGLRAPSRWANLRGVFHGFKLLPPPKMTNKPKFFILLII